MLIENKQEKLTHQISNDYRTPICLINVEYFFKSIIVDKETSCWIWKGSVGKDGYGKFSPLDKVTNKKKTYRSHRIAFDIFNNEKLENGKVVDHTCRNRLCVNPEHLRQVSYQQNAIENSVSPPSNNANKTHCKFGHEFNTENSYQDKKQRRCKICIKEQSKRYREYLKGKNK